METTFWLEFGCSAADETVVKRHRSKSQRKSKSHVSERTISKEPAKTPLAKHSKVRLTGKLLSILGSVLPLLTLVQLHTTVSPLAPLSSQNVFPKFALANTGNVPLETVTTECVVNGPVFRDVRISNAKLRSEAGPMAFEKISPGGIVSTSCGIRGTNFAEGTQLQIHNSYKVPYLRFPRSSDSYFRLVYDSEGKPRWDPDAGHPST